jgi:hypothetical protein
MAPNGLNDEQIYAQLSSDIRATDETSFKLMGIVPLVSGAGLLAVLIGEHTPRPGILVLLALFAASVTLGLFRWELRNIQNCRWLIKYADELEQRALRRTGLENSYVKQPNPPQGIGKREAEKLIYVSTVITWLVLPGALLQRSQVSSALYTAYLLISIVIAAATLISLAASAEVE